MDGEGVSAYAKSKTLAERAAWDFIAREGGELELSVVNPVGVFGPVLGPDYSTSILARAEADGRSDAGGAAALFWRSGCARCRGPAHPSDDTSGGEG